MLADPKQILAKFGRVRADSGRSQVNLGRIWSSPGRNRPKLVKHGPKRGSKPGQAGEDLARFGPTLRPALSKTPAHSGTRLERSATHVFRATDVFVGANRSETRATNEHPSRIDGEDC